MTTRRQLLAAAVAAPIIAVPASATPIFSCHPMGPSPEWLAASHKLEIASAAYDAYYNTVFGPLWDAAREREVAAGEAFPKTHMDIAGKIPAEIGAEEKRLETESYAAFRAVANFKAATPGDIFAKIEFLKSRECEIDHDQMLADLRRVFGWASS